MKNRYRKILAVTLVVNLLVSSFGILVYNRYCNQRKISDISFCFINNENNTHKKCCAEKTDDNMGMWNCCKTGNSSHIMNNAAETGAKIKALCCSESYNYLKNFDSYLLQNLNISFHMYAEYLTPQLITPLNNPNNSFYFRDFVPLNHSGPELLHIIGVMLA